MLEWGLKILASGVISYLIIGLFKTLIFYLVSYRYWVKGGKLEAKYISVEYDENDNEIPGTEIEEIVECSSWYEYITEEQRRAVIEEFEKHMSISMARDMSQSKMVKRMTLAGQFLVDTLSWPRFTYSRDLEFNKK